MVYKENTYWKNVLIIVPTIGAGLATLIYLLRLHARRLRHIGFLVEDVLMGIGLLLSYFLTGFVVDSALNGIGVPLDALPPHTRHRIQFDSWMIGKFWAPSMAVIKISIVLFLKRILGSVRSYEITSYCLIAFIATWATTVVLVSIFQCTPIKYYYDQSSPGHCMKGQVAFFQANGAIALAEDVVILCMPIPISAIFTNWTKRDVSISGRKNSRVYMTYLFLT
ncbi:uncharacterized protein ACLA_066560 [Aspergillus clavatus NRRL 1]|uniref:Integral membrane protein n=1 Tax=Aspergillus clavatus (strain ATCC 1007 / CBS 513.65 / DSM 816 / NCTC 3887 / NRRL 1 / QM 1276 / 107) TaxID=344612 RepID=A1CGE0_ASPCL|nr:uncharacterized protein ACLA_066560 [Aspergillus clavatus NRRL 1]EAW11020.1 integral membrane protein [Aspergillus clavatus NRRL 1]